MVICNFSQKKMYERYIYDVYCKSPNTSSGYFSRIVFLGSYGMSILWDFWYIVPNCPAEQLYQCVIYEQCMHMWESSHSNQQWLFFLIYANLVDQNWHLIYIYISLFTTKAEYVFIYIDHILFSLCVCVYLSHFQEVVYSFFL